MPRAVHAGERKGAWTQHARFSPRYGAEDVTDEWLECVCGDRANLRQDPGRMAVQTSLFRLSAERLGDAADWHGQLDANVKPALTPQDNISRF